MQDEVIAEAVRVEYSEHDGELYIVFKVINEFHKQKIKREWNKDIEFVLLDKKLISKGK